MPVALIIVPIIAAIVGLVIWSYTQEKKRLAELDAWARAGGWSFAPDRRKQQSVPFDLFNHGDARYSRFHAARRFEEATPGLASAALELFEYHYEETSGSGQNTATTSPGGVRISRFSQPPGVSASSAPIGETPDR